MKKSFALILLTLGLSFTLFAQNSFTPMDKSPLDMIYYPTNYPILKIQNKVTEPLAARILYSRPQKNGRKVFGELVELGKIWRLGANEATEIELFKDAKIGTTKVKKGKYTLYAIPNNDKWTIIINKEMDVWGAFIYNQSKDVVRIDIKTEKTSELIEAFSMNFEKVATGINLVIGWDDVIAKLPISF